MFDVQRVEIDWAGRPLVLETGRIARQAALEHHAPKGPACMASQEPRGQHQQPRSAPAAPRPEATIETETDTRGSAVRRHELPPAGEPRREVESVASRGRRAPLRALGTRSEERQVASGDVEELR